MKRIKVFISSVQNEFAEERQMLYEYLTTDALLGKFFEPFIFEVLPAKDQKANLAYSEQVKKSDIYIGIFGKEYGSIDKKGISPTEKEYDIACSENKVRLIFITNHKNSERNKNEAALIRKAENDVIRKMFSSPSELKTAVYASLVKYLEDKEYIRISPFDATIRNETSLNDLDPQKISQFVLSAKSKRGFPLPETAEPERILTHLNLLRDSKLTNAAILLFGKEPQRFIISSEVKCAQFYGTEVVKPIPAYQVYKGDVFQLVDQAVDFVLSRIDARVGNRSTSVDAPFEYEIPRAAVTEAIVNAVAHRDYTCNGTVQVMLFHDRLEIWNPGQLPYNLPLSKLKLPHSSYPANPLLAEPMYFAGYIERLGTGIPDMVEQCKNTGLKEPEFKLDGEFKTIFWRSLDAAGEVTKEVTGQVTPQATEQPTGQVTGQPTGQVIQPYERVVMVIKGELKRQEIQDILGLRHRETFLINYLNPAIDKGYVEMKYPDNPNHPNQRYRLTSKGKRLNTKLIKK